MTIFLGIELVEPPKSLGETRGNSKFDGFIPNFVGAFGTCTSRWCHLVSFLMTMCDILSTSYLDMASGLVKFVLCSLKTLSKTKQTCTGAERYLSREGGNGKTLDGVEKK